MHMQIMVPMLRSCVKFGVLLPVTSRGLLDPNDCLRNLEIFAESLSATTKGDTSCRSLSSDEVFQISPLYAMKVYIGVDESDAFLSKSTRIEDLLLRRGIVDVETKVLGHPPGSICAIWRDLARQAHEDGCDYTVLLGDDVILKTAGWMARFDQAFRELESERGVPRGFGCIAFADRYFPGFPTFPVMGRVHLEIFAGDVVPHDFINQDGDPYLFQLYRRWGCATMLQDVCLENTMGGSMEPRYEKKHHQDWTFSVLNDGAATIRAWLDENHQPRLPRFLRPPQELLTLDVVVPTFRVPLEGIDAIVNLKRSETCSTMVIIIVDNPVSPVIGELKARYEHDAFTRIRVNGTNCGASYSRNRGLAESAADYVLFLDDDVTPDPDILLECEIVIRQHPKACGFVGNSLFPDPTRATSVASSAIVLSGVTFFWGISKLLSEDIPWGVTANLLVRRYKDGVAFDLRFPKTGGGEDIDFCLRKGDYHVNNVPGGEGFRGAPRVMITHPWWNNGGRTFQRFRGWGIGDGALVKMYPNLTYLDAAPSAAETLLLVAVLCVVVGAAAVLLRDARLLPLFKLLVLSLPELFLTQALYDVVHHVWIDDCHHLPSLKGCRRVRAAAESSLVRMVSEWGRLEGIIRRLEWNCILYRFDWFGGRLKAAPMETERKHSRRKFTYWLLLVCMTATLLIEWRLLICTVPLLITLAAHV